MKQKQISPQKYIKQKGQTEASMEKILCIKIAQDLNSC